MAHSQEVAMKITIQDDSVFRRLDNKTTPLRFKVQSVADSMQQKGAFARFHERNTLRALATIEPLDFMEIVTSGFRVQFAITDDNAIDVDLPTCAAIVQGMQVLSVQDVAASQEPPSYVASCSPELFVVASAPHTGSASVLGNCSCAVSIMHFTTFALVDAVPDRIIESKNLLTTMEVVDFAVFLPIALGEFTPDMRALFVVCVGNAYARNALQVQVLQVDRWPPLPAGPGGVVGRAGSSEIKISVRVTGLPPLREIPTGVLDQELLRNGMPSTTSGAVSTHTRALSGEHPSLLFLIAIVSACLIVVVGAFFSRACWARSNMDGAAVQRDTPWEAREQDYMQVLPQQYSVYTPPHNMQVLPQQYSVYTSPHNMQVFPQQYSVYTPPHNM